MLDAVLLDIDGTLTFQGTAIEGANEALLAIERLGLKFKLLSNISERSPEVIAQELQSLGFTNITASHIYTSSLAAAQWVSTSAASYTDLLIPGAVRPLFPSSQLNRENPDYIIVGGVSDGFDTTTINRAFQLIRSGATLIAMHKNAYSLTPHGPELDSGAYIAALEYATGTKATICGKPSASFFASVLSDLGSSAASTIIVGDDRLTDIAGGQAAGISTVQVETGKGRDAVEHKLQPDHKIPSVAALPALVNSIIRGQPEA